ncbi:peroxisome proliferator-activated receptor gamma coactivator 1-beta-like isoform X2 [Lates japonicus]|uniref:Peroxisome proliferator-activated receptor gamma coactivator 1-beta-like isoform X2 n=1 Tax=Lates japonicus TaxID=270547 RepID=A0AAD3NF44_LATJO|nr:peroxisome proliferator-activated receptor gamma coactivator 1-beta-like isoform X2 [Lates japonicus]
MADCAPLLDEELSSFVFNYLTENSGSQVRYRPLRTHGTLGFADRGASLRVAGRSARYARLMRAFRPACQQHLPGSARPGVSEMSSVAGDEESGRIKANKGVCAGAGSRAQPVCCCSGRIIWYAEGRFGNF